MRQTPKVLPRCGQPIQRSCLIRHDATQQLMVHQGIWHLLFCGYAATRHLLRSIKHAAPRFGHAIDVRHGSASEVATQPVARPALKDYPPSDGMFFKAWQTTTNVVMSTNAILSRFIHCSAISAARSNVGIRPSLAAAFQYASGRTAVTAREVRLSQNWAGLPHAGT
ncbi:MAG: hypothetical protein H7337_24505 [Rhizobacter sp.]|nr:hypothetical protein [Rhizobacter sp.]